MEARSFHDMGLPSATCPEHLAILVWLFIQDMTGQSSVQAPQNPNDAVARCLHTVTAANGEWVPCARSLPGGSEATDTTVPEERPNLFLLFCRLYDQLSRSNVPGAQLTSERILKAGNCGQHHDVDEALQLDGFMLRLPTEFAKYKDLTRSQFDMVSTDFVGLASMSWVKQLTESAEHGSLGSRSRRFFIEQTAQFTNAPHIQRQKQSEPIDNALDSQNVAINSSVHPHPNNVLPNAQRLKRKAPSPQDYGRSVRQEIHHPPPITHPAAFPYQMTTTTSQGAGQPVFQQRSMRPLVTHRRARSTPSQRVYRNLAAASVLNSNMLRPSNNISGQFSAPEQNPMWHPTTLHPISEPFPQQPESHVPSYPSAVQQISDSDTPIFPTNLTDALLNQAFPYFPAQVPCGGPSQMPMQRAYSTQDTLPCATTCSHSMVPGISSLPFSRTTPHTVAQDPFQEPEALQSYHNVATQPEDESASMAPSSWIEYGTPSQAANAPAMYHGYGHDHEAEPSLESSG